MSDAKPTTRYVNDPRMDKFISWGLSAATAVALSVGAFFFNGIQEQQAKQAARSERQAEKQAEAQKQQTRATQDLRSAIGELKTSIALLARTEEDLAEHELEAAKAFDKAEGERKELRGRVRALELERSR